MQSGPSKRAAEYVSALPRRARALPTSRDTQRLPGSSATAVQLHQGNRRDLHPVDLDTALSIADTADAIVTTHSESARLRLFFEFLRGSEAAGPDALLLVSQEPRTTGDRRFDALLAAAAERLCARYHRPGPRWTTKTNRFLDHAWWVSDLSSAKILAIKWTPASYARRGIYLDAHDLTQDGTYPTPENVAEQPEILAAFHLLATKLQTRNIIGHVHRIGTAPMLLAYHSRTITGDIDTIFAPNRPIIDTICEVAREKHWPSSWLNNHVAFNAARSPGEAESVFDHPHLQVMATPAEHLLAMKVLAARPVQDAADAQILLQQLSIRTADRLWEIISRYFADDMISQRSRLFLKAILAQA